MKKGDVVKVDDSSYSFTIIENCLEHCAGGPQKEQHVIIATDCNLPADDEYTYCDSQYNNTIIRGQISGKITFIQQRFLRPVSPAHKIMIDITRSACCIYGEAVEISDKLYKEIKREQTQTE